MFRCRLASVCGIQPTGGFLTLALVGDKVLVLFVFVAATLCRAELPLSPNMDI